MACMAFDENGPIPPTVDEPAAICIGIIILEFYPRLECSMYLYPSL